MKSKSNVEFWDWQKMDYSKEGLEGIEFEFSYDGDDDTSMARIYIKIGKFTFC